MARPPVRNWAPMLGVVALISCGESTAPSAPATTAGPTLAETSHPWTPNSWTSKAALPGYSLTGDQFFGVDGVAAAVANNSAGQPIIYALGGTDRHNGTGYEVQAYNLATNTWTRKNGRLFAFNTNGVGKIGGKLYISGGYTYDNGAYAFAVAFPYLWAYDVATDRMIRRADMPKATGDGVTGVINGKLYVVPGTCSGEYWPDPHYCDQPTIRQLFRYDPVANVWTTLARPPHFHVNAAAGVIHGKFYVAGGGNAYLDVYDPWSNTWKTLAPIPAPRAHAAGAIQNGKLWVIGSNGSNRNTYAYDPLTNGWTTKAPLPQGGATDAAAPLSDSQSHILVIGGGPGTLDHPATSELYTP